MPYPLWEKVSEFFPRINGYLDEKSMIKYLKQECGLVDTGNWSHPYEDEFGEWDSNDELYHYRVTNKKKFSIFLLRWA